uniref:Zw10 kinetochore protein n=1 Tax=Cyclopterus lumpus TaxID=8103 RepID=A0A8C2ZU95_CYCLU
MASFVTEVLASSGKLEKDDLSSKISKMSRKVEDTKEEVCDMMNKRYSEFLPSLQGSQELMVQVDEVSKEMDGLKNCIETEVQQNVHVAVAEYAKLKQQLEKNTIVITMLRHLKEFHSAMEEFNKALLEKKYVDAANQLERARASVDSLKGWKTSQLLLLSALSSELTVQRENLIYHLGDEWKRLVIWRLPSSKGKSFLKVELNLSQVLLKTMLKPLVMYPSLSVRVSEQPGEGTIMALQCLQESHNEKSTPSQVYSKLLLVLRTLHSHLLGTVRLGPCRNDIRILLNVTVLIIAILGELIWEEISQCIIHECLLYSIPTNNSQLEKYKTVIKETEEFEKSLKQMEYLQGDSTELLKYARDVNCHFASKKCKDVIVAARKLMTSKMHNTVKITPDYKLRLPKLPAPASELKVKQETIKDEMTMENTKQLSAWSLSLPSCRISESVQQLMELALNTLCEAVGSSTQCALQLFFTVRNIFQLFYDVVPTYHKENLLKFPHLAAIQHNNCMYLAHHLLTLGHHFRARLPQPLSEGVATFVDMVPGFRKLGAQCFLAQMNVQRAEMLERLSTAHNFCNLDDEDNYIAASKAVRQDISSEDGEHLHTLCQTIIEEGPLVFIPLAEENKNKKYQEEVPLYVRKWSTFKELVIVLRANLQEIVDRWADAKGPLASEFSSSEVKNLIRALFQNTERRAVALTKIK